MVKLIFCVIFIAAAWFWFSEQKRKNGIREAEDEFQESKMKNEELTSAGVPPCRIMKTIISIKRFIIKKRD